MAREDTECGVLKSGYAEGSRYRVHFGSDGKLKLLDEVRSPWLSWARTLVKHHIPIVPVTFVRRVCGGIDFTDRDRQASTDRRPGLLWSARLTT